MQQNNVLRDRKACSLLFGTDNNGYDRSHSNSLIAVLLSGNWGGSPLNFR